VIVRAGYNSTMVVPDPLPLVTCICPTKDRAEFMPGCIKQFLAQDYPNKELVILGDRMKSIDFATGMPLYLDADWEHILPNVRYFPSPRYQARYSVGQKRNILCELAQGSIICHWDDDDIYLPRRISEQVAVLEETGKSVTGYQDMEFADQANDRKWMFTGHDRYAVGVSLCYRKAFWEKLKFPHFDVGEDNDWQQSISDADMEIRTGAQIIARIHKDNTCPKSEDIQLRNREYWREIL
jgi:glycosyltransferase involved in cell wall biosynthesis